MNSPWQLTLGQAIRAAAARAPAKPAIISAPLTLSYRDLLRRMSRAGNAAIGQGLAAGDRVALITPNCAEYVEVVAGLSDAGLIVATLSPQLSETELGPILADCDAKLIIAAASVRERCRASALGAAPVVTLGPQYEAWLAQASDAGASRVSDDRAPFALCYTSGTTGLPKGVILSHRSRMLTIVAAAGEYGCFGPDEDFLSFAPLHFGGPFAFTVANLTLGGTARIMSRFDEEAIVSELGEGSVTGMFVVPTHLLRFTQMSDATFAKSRPNRLKTIISNAAALPQSLKEQSIKLFGPGLLHETYGSTEAGIVTNIRPADQLRKSNCAGVPFAHTLIELRDETGVPVADGEIGELFSRSPFLFDGYLNKPDETAATLRDGWVSVGDLAVRDEEGFHYIVDRVKDMVISGGVNIYPKEIENVIGAVTGVVEVAVVGLPDAEWGELLHAVVVTTGDHQAVTAAIKQACREQMAGFKQPRTISFIGELPRNANGKVQKKELRAALSTGGGGPLTTIA